MNDRYTKKIEELRQSAKLSVDMAETYERKASDARFDAEVLNKMAEFLEKFHTEMAIGI